MPVNRDSNVSSHVVLEQEAIVQVELFDISDAARMRDALAVRTRVFVGEQGVPPELEIDEHDLTDARAVHALAREGDEPIGAGRFYEIDAATVQIGRMAVLSASRGSGAGSRILAALAEEARRRGYARARLHAQLQAMEFYVKAGFIAGEETLWDAGILHRAMERGL
jgi:predicted GNAT family N-acyltransferase